MEGPRRRWLGNPLSWRTADRCLAIALLMTGAATVVLVSVLTGGWPFLPYPTHEAAHLPWVQGTAVVSWIATSAIARVLRRRDRGARALAVWTIGLFAVTLAGFTLLAGPFAAPGWIAFLGGAVVGYVMFPRWLAVAGIALYATIVIGGSLALGSGDFGTLFGPEAAFAGLDLRTVARRATAALALFALTFLVIVYIVERWRDREAGYQRLASTDSLTGLTNRRRFLELAAGELARARRYGSQLALILVDLDHFKRINDEHGHLVGDRALVHAAGVLAASVRDVDVIARHGGEEFAILLPMTEGGGAVEVAERCTRRLADTPLLVDGASIRITASMGVAACAGASCGTIDDLLKAADAALYRAKEQGRDRVELAKW